MPSAQFNLDAQIGSARDEVSHRAVGGQFPRVGPHGDGKVSRLKPLQQLDLALGQVLCLGGAVKGPVTRERQGMGQLLELDHDALKDQRGTNHAFDFRRQRIDPWPRHALVV